MGNAVKDFSQNERDLDSKVFSCTCQEAFRDMAENESGEDYSSRLTGCSAIMRNVPEAGAGWGRRLHCKATR
jgi:hypothetical protein